MIKRIALIFGAFLCAVQLSAQVVGSRDNSDLSPGSVEAAKLSGGGFTGDVNVFNGTYNASHSLGGVSTPGGLGFELSLSYTPSYSAGQTPSVCSGIPYGEGWSPGIPMITASNAAYFAFLSDYECSVKTSATKDTNNYYVEAVEINGVDRLASRFHGDVFWFSPTVSIPGVASGRAVFKYIDEDDAGAAVFVLNKFERYVELRFYGDRWRVLVDNGNQYEFTQTLVTYRAPNNQRVLDYNTFSASTNNDVTDVITDNNYGIHQEEVLNTLEPKQAYTSWYCSVITNRNIPNQSVLLEYEKFGGFNYFQEFEQPLLAAAMSSKLRNLGSFTPDYTAYTDILLTKVTSFIENSPYEILDLGYELSDFIGSRMLDPNDVGVERLDSLYAYETVFSDGLGADQFSNWNRYYHGQSDGAESLTPGDLEITSTNPYITTTGHGIAGNAYIRQGASTADDISFDHAFLESPRILTDGLSLVPGDIYEIRTKVSDGNGSDAAMGTGTIDINIVTGDLDYVAPGVHCTEVTDSVCTDSAYFPTSVSTFSSLDNNASGTNAYPTTDYYETRRLPVFSTHNQAIKWHMPATETAVNTSNFFVMPNIPDHCDGMNIQVGPGNSDTKYSEENFGMNIAIDPSSPTVPSAYNGYWHNLTNIGSGASYEDVPQNFGIGMPWSMTAPLYVGEMGGYSVPADETNAYEFWWNEVDSGYPWSNEPTKFNENVRLEEVELIRYSKVPYMLSNVKLYRVNGEISPLDDTSGIILIAQNELEYNYDSKYTIENIPYDFDKSDTLVHSTTYNQYVYTLNSIKNIPVAGWEKNPAVADTYADSTLLQTEFEYEWYGYEDGETLVYGNDGNPGRRTRVMTKYTDQLGGETHIDYYNRESRSTLKEGRYTGIQQCAAYNADPVIGEAFAFDVHPAVHYITKLDEKNNVETALPGAPLKRWEYVYDSTQIIFQSFDYYLPGNFRQGYKKSYSKGFAKTTVYDPELESGEQNYTEYFHHGNVYHPDTTGGVITPDTSTTNEYLYFGKPDRIVRYNDLNQIEEETFFEYGYTKAHENGYARNKMTRNNMISSTDYDGITNWVHARDYEYGDYYRNEAETYDTTVSYGLILNDQDTTTDLSYVIGDTTVYELEQTLAYTNLDGVITSIAIPGYQDSIPESQIVAYPISGSVTNETAKAVVSNFGYIGNSWGGPLEKARFLETYFYTDLAATNPDFYLHSYFIKTTKQTNRSYDDACEIDQDEGGVITIPIGETVNPSPFGPSHTNPIISAQIDPSLIAAINGSTDGTSVEAGLISNSPLSENVLTVFVGKIGQFNASVIKNVLVAQSALSDNILNSVYNGINSLGFQNSMAIFNDQPYLSDAFLFGIASTAHQYSDQIIKSIYNVNSYLSDTVMIELSEASNFSQNVLKDVLLLQGQMSENVLVSVASEANSNSGFAVESILLGQPVLTDTIFYEIACNAGLTNSEILGIYSNAQTYPSDNALITLMDSTTISDQNLVTLFQSSDHYFDDSLTNKIYAELSLENADQAIKYQENHNPYGIYCNDDVTHGRDYVETVTEYDYYEANYDGSTLAEGYKKLLGQEDVIGKVITGSRIGHASNLTLTDIKLKHQPSWQVFKTKTYSPDYPNAYQEQEYYYYYDLLNRKSRHPEYYDLNDPRYDYYVDTNLFYNDTAWVFGGWPTDHQFGGSYAGHIALHDAESAAQRNNLRNIAFQSTAFTQNNSQSGSDPVMVSEYYVYDSRWNRPEQDVDSTIDYSGPYCGDTDTTECEECIYIKWTGSEEEVMDQVPWNYCAYQLVGGSIKACPTFVDPEDCGDIIHELIGCNPESEDPALDTIAPKIAPTTEALDKGMYLRDVVIQIDTISSTADAWRLERMDSTANTYIMDFYLAGSQDSLLRRESFPIYPFDTLTARTIDQRNRFTQVQLEHDMAGIYTRYEFEPVYRIWHRNTNNGSCPGYGNYSSMVVRNIGLPKSVTVGSGRSDSLTTQYAYYLNFAIDSIVDPNGYRMHYTYDDYDRLANTYENSRLLSKNSYHYWQRDTSLNFAQRTAQNYVSTHIHNGPSASDEHVRAFIDPLGRNFSTSTSIDNDSTQVHSGTVWYDNWSRVTRAFKPYKLTDRTVYQPTSDTTLAYAHSLYENTPKSRTLRGAKYGITNILDTHTVKQNYKLIDEVILSCELGLKAPEVALLINPEFDGDLKFIRAEIRDEDEKKVVSYTNAIGQKVATLQYGENEADELITLFAYDNYGNLTTVINPEKQWTRYQYNMLGQLIKETTVDAGNVHYMYNRQGLLSISQDENGRVGEVPPGLTDTTQFFRHYEYDAYGRLLKQKRCYRQEADTYPVENNPGINPLFYKDTVAGVDGSGGADITDVNPENYFEYIFSNRSTYDWLAEMNYVGYTPTGGGTRNATTGSVTGFIDLGNGTLEKAFDYGEDSTNNYLGKVKTSWSYDAVGGIAEKITYSYDDENRVLSELIEFSAVGDLTNPTGRVTTKITYPNYNYRGSLETMQVDVANDGVLDFQYTYNYDQWNRLREIYVSFKAGEYGNRVVSYDYDDALGLLTETKHYANYSNAGCMDEVAQTITHSYDVRDRLTSITSELFDYYLYYDNNAPSHADFTAAVNYDQNWNGNINGSVADYKLDITGVTNSVDLFDSATVYGFKYDLMNRLYEADAHAGDRVTAEVASFGIGDVQYNYDKIGNITNLKRGLLLSGTDLVNEEWNYKYTTGTNRLDRVQGMGGTTTRNYEYDSNGNLMSDDFRELDTIHYARANYPFHIDKGSDEIDYLYSNSNQRIYKRNASIDTTEEYYLKNVGILDLKTNEWTWFVTGANRDAKIRPKDYQQPKNITTSPAILNDTLEVAFYLYDHLGNSRLVYTPKIQCPAFIEYSIDYAADYYPYGKILRQFSAWTTAEKYLTTQHERDIETGLDYRGARFYDSDIGRFLSLDPHAADYPQFSDYCYVVGNPIMLIDPDGKDNKPTDATALHSTLPEWVIWIHASYNPTGAALLTNSYAMESMFGDEAWVAKYTKRLSEHGLGVAAIDAIVGTVQAYSGDWSLSALDIAFGPGMGMNYLTSSGLVVMGDGLANGNAEAWADLTVIALTLRTEIYRGKKINIYGEGEAPGFKDYAVNPEYQTGGNGVKRPLTKDITSNSVAEIEINNSPLFEAELAEISRISRSGTTIRYTAPKGSKFFENLSNHLNKDATLNSDITKSIIFEGHSTEMRTVTYIMN